MIANCYCFFCHRDFYQDMSLEEYLKGAVLCGICGEGGKILGQKSNFSIQKAEAVAVYADKKGNEFSVDKKGNVIGENQFKRDPKGWKRAGKSTKGYERTVIL